MVKVKQMCSPRVRAILFTLLVLAVLAGSYALFRMPQVTESFNEVSDRKVLLIHAKWCGHCRTLLEPAGTWSQLKKVLPAVRFEELEEQAAGPQIAKYGVQGFPDIRVVDAAGETVAKFAGPRDVASLQAFVMANVPVVEASSRVARTS